MGLLSQPRLGSEPSSVRASWRRERLRWRLRSAIPIWTKVASVTLVAIGISALWAHFPFVPAALAFYGAGIGLESIARGTLPLAMFGPHGYATVMGRLGMPSLLAQAAAPWIGALLLQRLEATGMLGVLVSVGFLNVGLSLALYHCVSTSAGIRRRSGEPKAKL